VSEHVFEPGSSVQEASVVYTTKELLLKIDRRFDRLEALAEGSFTRAEGETLGRRVNALEQDASGTKAVAKALLESGKDRWSKNEKVAGLVVAIFAVAPTLKIFVDLFSG